MTEKEMIDYQQSALISTNGSIALDLKQIEPSDDAPNQEVRNPTFLQLVVSMAKTYPRILVLVMIARIYIFSFWYINLYTI